MKVSELIGHIKKVRAGEGDFSQLIEQLYEKRRNKTDVISLKSVKNAKKLNKIFAS